MSKNSEWRRIEKFISESSQEFSLGRKENLMELFIFDWLFILNN
jgi:hypothetical protein